MRDRLILLLVILRYLRGGRRGEILSLWNFRLGG